MNYTDDQLKQALRRQDPPAGFADRLLARVAEQDAASAESPRRSWLNFFTQPALRWASVAALCVTLLVTSLYYRHAYLEAERQRAEGEAAKQQLMLALRIASSKLQHAKSKVQSVSLEQDQNHQVKE